MKIRLVYLAILFLILLSCEKENYYTDSYRRDIIFTNIRAYPNDSIRLNFKILTQKEDSSLTIQWIAPDTLGNKANGIMLSKTDILIEFNILDNNKLLRNISCTILIDTILSNSEYDFRNDFIGNFYFYIHHVMGDINIGNYLDTNYIVSGFVARKGELSSALVEVNYGTDTILISTENGVKKILKENSELVLGLDNSLLFPGGIGGYGHTGLYGEFINNDSLVLNVSAGGRGFWDARNIFASKKTTANTMLSARLNLGFAIQ